MANTKSNTNTAKETKTAVKTETAEKEQETAETAKVTKNEDSVAKSIDAISEVVNSMSREEVTAEEVGAKVKPSNDKEIPVKSVTFGGLTWISSKTNSHYRWNEIGAIEYIPFGELVTMNNTAREFLFDPLVILLDKDAAKYFRLDAVYKNFACVDALEKMFEAGDLDEIESALNKIKMTNMRDVAISKICTLYKDDKLNNIKIINLVEKILCFDLRDKD